MKKMLFLAIALCASIEVLAVKCGYPIPAGGVAMNACNQLNRNRNQNCKCLGGGCWDTAPRSLGGQQACPHN